LVVDVAERLIDRNGIDGLEVVAAPGRFSSAERT
jgi:hypothetical protein